MKYVLAGTQPWTREVFARLQQTCPGDWCHVSTPAELDAAVMRAPRWIFVLHWHWWIQSRIWQSIETVNFHAAPLPWGRGGNVIEHQIMAGRTETVITAHRVTGELDAGPIYARSEAVSLAGTKEQILAGFIAPCVQLITHILDAQPEPVPQQGEVVTFKRLPADEYAAFWGARS